MEIRDDCLEVTVVFQPQADRRAPDYIKVYMKPEDWDKLYTTQNAWINETNNERECSLETWTTFYAKQMA